MSEKLHLTAVPGDVNVVHYLLQAFKSENRDIINDVCETPLIVPKLSTCTSYTTNVSYTKPESRCVVRFYGVQRRFTWLIFTSGTEYRLIIYWNVSDGQKIKLVPYYDCLLETPDTRVGAALLKSIMIKLSLSKHAFAPEHTSRRKADKVYINHEDSRSNPRDLRLYYLDKAKSQWIAVLKQNVDDMQKRDVNYGTKEVTVHSLSDRVKSSNQLIEDDLFQEDLLESDDERGLSIIHDTEHHKTKLEKTGRRTVVTRVNISHGCVTKKRKNDQHPFQRLEKAKERSGSKVTHSKSRVLRETRSGCVGVSSVAHGTKHHGINLKQAGQRTVTIYAHNGCVYKIHRNVKKQLEQLRNAQESKVTHSKSRKARETQSVDVHEGFSSVTHHTKQKQSGRRAHAYMHNIRRNVQRPFERLGKAKERSVSKATHSKSRIAQETQSGISVLDFSRKRSAYSVLTDHSPSDDSDRLYRHSSDFDKSDFSTAVRIPVSMLRERFLGLPTKRSVNRLSSSRSNNGANLPPSRTRSVGDSIVHHGSEPHEGEPNVHVVRPPFDTTVLTELLHAQAYSKILLLTDSVPRDIPADSLIPLLFIRGVAYFKLSKYEDAREHFKQCEAIDKRVHRDGDTMLCNAYLGDMEYASQSYVKAADYYKTAIRHYTNGCVALTFKLTPPTLSAIHAKLASSYRNASMAVQAIHHYKTAVDVAQIDRDRLSAHTSLGNLYQSMGDNSNALTEYKQSIELANKLSDRVSLGWAHGNIGNAYLGLNRKDEALHHLQKSLDLAVEYEQTPQAIGRTYNNLGTAYQSMNDLDKAEEYYDLALSQAVYGNDIAGQARVYGNIGNVHMLRKNYERAIPHYGEVLRLSSDPATTSTARHNRGCAYYEWATSLLEKAGLSKCNFHGPDCDVDECLGKIPRRALDLYKNGCEDLRGVVKYHEERLQHIKGSPSGLTLSVSLFESNSRTFHRLQDCLVNLHRYEEALVVAEQSRARTLGELLLKRKGLNSLTSPPLSFDQIVSIIRRMKCPLLYFSYTGARLICWMFLPRSCEITWSTFEIPLADDQFDGKSFDYYLRYSLTEKLVEHSFEMYQRIEYDLSSSEEVQKLFELVGKPLVSFLQKQSDNSSTFEQATVVSDSYTTMLPLTCLLDSQTKSFLGDHYFFSIAPSMLTMGIMSENLSSRVEVQANCNDVCIVGDPNIPAFRLNGDLWGLGRLPYAKREAEWVAHAFNASPMLGDQATKSSLLIRLMSAKVVHIATHGSASSGFLAFAPFAVSAPSGSDKYVDSSNVLLYPKEVEKLHISPALVVLSSCDSGRGTVKADGIQGMARAFILAGAQSVLTTLWKVPDESASVFMQFFYQYLMDGLRSSLALQKAILSVRCFAKYSQYIHWSGYQLTGRDTTFSFKSPSLVSALKHRLGEASSFPRLADIKKLEKALVNNPRFPTDVQILRGPPGVEPSEVAIDFITSFHNHFSGGVFWINCLWPEMVQYSIEYIEKVCISKLGNLPVSEIQPALFVFDHMTKLPDVESLLRVLKSYHVHIIVLSKGYETTDKLVKEVDHKLIRGCSIQAIEPLTRIHSTQRLVHQLMKEVDFAPTTADQHLFEQLAEFTTGSPILVNVTGQVLLNSYKNHIKEANTMIGESLSLKFTKSPTHTYPLVGDSSPVRSVSRNVFDTLSTIAEVSKEHRDIWETDSVYDSWDSITMLISSCDLSSEEQFLLHCLSAFGSCPVPLSLVVEISSVIAETTKQAFLTSTLHHKLVQFKLMKPYPLPVVTHPHNIELLQESEPELVYMYVPQHIAECLLNGMDKLDKVATFCVLRSSLSRLHLCDSSSVGSVHTFCSVLGEVFELNYKLVGKESYQNLYNDLFNCQGH